MTDQLNHSRELMLTRLIDVPREKLYRCWTEPELMVQWFTPAPWSTKSAEADLRPGGASMIVMCDPEGKEYPNAGQYLELVPNEKLVFTDAFLGDWVPSKKPFMTGIITFEDEAGQTRYTARALHWTDEDCENHKNMGFHEGWGKATDQLTAVARTL